MTTAIETINSYGAPIDSKVKAIQYFNETLYSHEQYDDMTSKIIGETVNHTNHVMARYTFLYVVQEVVGANISNTPIEVGLTYVNACTSAEQFINKNPWASVAIEDGSSDADGVSIKPRTGKKRGMKKGKLVEQLYCENKNLSRKEIIALFIEKVGTTAAGAATYASLCKKKFG